MCTASLQLAVVLMRSVLKHALRPGPQKFNLLGAVSMVVAKSLPCLSRKCGEQAGSCPVVPLLCVVPAEAITPSAAVSHDDGPNRPGKQLSNRDTCAGNSSGNLFKC